MQRATPRTTGRTISVAVVALLLVGCASSTPSSPSVSTAAGVAPTAVAATPGAASAAASLSAADAWAHDLEDLDKVVRAKHVSPFTIHTEAEWNAKLAEIGPKVASADPDEQFALVSSLVGLLDTHSWLIPNGGFHAYEVLFYKFSDGWFTVAAKDPSLVGTRLLSIGGHPIADVETMLRPLIPHDNENGFLDSVESALSYVEYLHGTGIVADPAEPQYVLVRPDGTSQTVDSKAVGEDAWIDEFHILGDLVGTAPEAVARRGERVWTRLDTKRKAFLVSVNDYGDMTTAGEAMTVAFDSGKAARVVLDIRYLRGGSGDFALFDILKNDPRVNREGGLTVLMGRENVSVATLFDYEFDVHTHALTVGEATPARADNFRCDCFPITMPQSGIEVDIPTTMSNNGDTRPTIEPEIAMALSSKDFFAGRDPVLDAALKGLSAP